MKVIERYIFRRVLMLFGASLAWTLAIVWTTQILTRINLVTDSGQSALAFFEIAALILPSVLPVVIPFAAIIAIAQTLTAMNNDSELVVIAAAGGSQSTLIRPVMLFAVLASVASFAIDNGADPYARQRGRELVAAARADFLSLVIQEGTFRKIEDGLFIQIGERLSDGRLAGIFVADSRTEGTDLVYYARHGTVREEENGETILVMQDGEIHRKLADGEISVIRFQSYAFDLSAFTASSGKPTLRPKDRTLGYLFEPDHDDPIFQRNPQSFRAELHRRFTEWAYTIVFALIALAVVGNARSHRESRINPMVTAIIIALVVRWMGYFAANQVQVAAALWPVVYAIPLVVSAICIWFIATNRTMELPVAMADRLIAGMRRLGDRMMFMRIRRDTEPGGAS
ncbi:LPS export ABC transporter permease LptF [Mesorhizobium sp. ZMM04-5]|uniref:LPS export ABC transporter permease LptF n=1 Tax=Mesorhizobium marinum TaxID=3228790 RepID=A0ABV3R2Q5_9HYPH